MRTLVTFIGLLLCITHNDAQPSLFEIEMKITNGAGVNLTIEKNNTPFISKQLDKNGRLNLVNIPYGDIYFISFSKKKMVTKTIHLDTKTNYFIDESNETKVIIEFDMIEEMNYVSYGLITSLPIGKMHINRKGELVWDDSYNQKRKEEIDLFINSVSEISEKNKLIYNDILSQTGALIKEEKYDDAQTLAEKAKLIEYTSKLKELELAIQQGKEKGNSELGMIAKIERVADSLFNSRELEKALKYYKRILSLKPDHGMAFKRISTINDLLNVSPKNTANCKPFFSQEEMIANARISQENRIQLVKEYKYRTFPPIERNISYDPYKESKPSMER